MLAIIAETLPRDDDNALEEDGELPEDQA